MDKLFVFCKLCIAVHVVLYTRHGSVTANTTPTTTISSEACPKLSVRQNVSNDMIAETTIDLDLICRDELNAPNATFQFNDGDNVTLLNEYFGIVTMYRNGSYIPFPRFRLLQPLTGKVIDLRGILVWNNQAVIDVYLHIDNYNDPPVLTILDQRYIPIKENETIGVIIASVNVTDPDISAPNKSWQTITIDVPSFMGIVKTGQQGVYNVTITRPIDLEQMPKQYKMEREPLSNDVFMIYYSIVAQDGTGLQSNKESMFVRIQDVNDCPVVCPRSGVTVYVPSIVQEEYTALDILSVCTDADVAPVNRIRNCYRASTYCGNGSYIQARDRMFGMSYHLIVTPLFTQNKTVCDMKVNVTDNQSVFVLTVHFRFAECGESVDSRGTLWPVARLGSDQYSICPEGYTGRVSRYCDVNGVYQDAIYNCTNKAILDIYNKIMYAGGPDKVNTSSVLTDLSNATSQNSTKSRPLLIGDLQTLNSIMTLVTDYVKPTSKTIVNETESFIDVVNNMIKEEVTTTWTALMNKTGSGAGSVIERLDDFVAKLAGNSSTQLAINQEYAKSNLFVQLKQLDGCSKDITFPDKLARNVPTWASKDQLQIPCNNGLKLTSYSSVIYRNMSKMVTSQMTGQQSVNSEINAPVMSFTYFPKLEGQSQKLASPIRLTFQVFDKSLGRPMCSYMKSNNSVGGSRYWAQDGCHEVNTTDPDTVVCQCDHLTNFAVLMSPVGGNTEHHVALTVISITGCIISMIGLIATVAVYGIYWRIIVSDRAKLLMNLCVALFLSLLLFVSGVSQTQHSGVCTGIAVLLHYGYLLVFFLMLAEGIHLCYKVLFPLGTRNMMLPVLIAAYVTPLVIVAIAMGATQLTGYGNEKFCWLSSHNGLVWAFITPVLLIIAVNMAILVLVLRQMFNTTAISKKSDREKAKTGLRSICILLPIFGITWLFGAISVSDSTVAFQYIFAICNSLQGLLIFIVQCLMNRKIQEAFRKRRARQGAPSGETSPMSEPNSAAKSNQTTSTT